MSKRLVILDFELFEKAGHGFEYDSNVCRAFVSQGWEAIIYANRRCRLPDAGGIPIKPWFSYSVTEPITRWKALRPLAKILIHLWRTRQELIGLAAAEDSSETVFFAQHVEAYQLLPLYFAFRNIKGRLVIMLRCSSCRFNKGRAVHTFRTILYRHFLSLLARMAKQLTLVTDSELLQREFAALTPLPCHVLPIPNPSASMVPNPRHMDGPLRLVMVGRASLDKGIQYAPGILREARARGIPCRFTIHWYVRLVDDNPHLDSLREEIETLMGEGDEMVRQSLSKEAYHNSLQEADVALLLYDPDRYGHQTSGILIDAIAAGCFPVVCEHTWLAQAVQQLKFGAAVPWHPEDQIPSSVVDLLEQGLPEEAPGELSSFVEYHSQEKFYREFIQCVLLDKNTRGLMAVAIGVVEKKRHICFL